MQSSRWLYSPNIELLYKSIYCSLIRSIFLIFPATALAADDPEKLFFAEMPLVLTASRLPQPLADAPGAVTIIDRDMIRATGYRNIPDLLRLVPGFNVAFLRGWWGVVSYHGLAGNFSNRVLVRINDRPVNSEFWNSGIEWSSLPIDVDDIERIEVLRGSNSASFGTNAFLGVINIRTRAPDVTNGHSLKFSGGSGVKDGVLRSTFTAGNAVGSVSLGRRGDNGLDKLIDDSLTNYLNVAVDLDQDRDSYHLALGGARTTAGEGFRLASANVPRQVYPETAFVQASWTRQLARENEFSLHFYHNRERYRDESSVLAPPPFPPVVVLDQNRVAIRTSLEFKHLLRLTPTLRAAWGADFRQDQVTARYFLGPIERRTRQTRRAFGQLEWRATPDLLINAGALVEEVTNAATRASPRLFANYTVADGHVLRVGYSSATRAPTFFESFANQVTTSQGVPLLQTFIGNDALAPERIRAVEAGYYGQSADHRYEADVRIYREDLSNLIRTIRTPVAPPPGFGTSNSVFINADTVHLTGISLQLKARPWSGTQLLLNHSAQKIDQDQRRFEQSAPPNSTTLGWVQQFDRDWTATLLHYRVGRIEWLEFGDRIEPYHRTDVRLARRFKLGATQAELSVVGLNLFGTYREFRNGDPGEEHDFSRRVFATLRLDF